MTNILLDINPNLVRFSQTTINKKYSGIYSTKDVENWEDCEPYNFSILTIHFGAVRYTSYDNRRLFSARRKLIQYPGVTIKCRVKESTDVIGPEAYAILSDANEFIICWKQQHEITGSLIDGYHLITCIPTSYGGAILVRAASQGSTFPVEGTLIEPTFGDRMEGVKANSSVHGLVLTNIKPVDINSDFTSDNIPDDSFFGLTRKVLYDHKAFIQQVKTNFTWFSVRAHTFYPNSTMKARAGFDEDQFDDSCDEHFQYCDDELLNHEIPSKIHFEDVRSRV